MKEEIQEAIASQIETWLDGEPSTFDPTLSDYRDRHHTLPMTDKAFVRELVPLLRGYYWKRWNRLSEDRLFWKANQLVVAFTTDFWGVIGYDETEEL